MWIILLLWRLVNVQVHLIVHFTDFGPDYFGENQEKPDYLVKKKSEKFIIEFTLLLSFTYVYYEA